jgi:hypothetical protein
MIECLHRPRYKLAWISHNFPTHKHVFLERSANPHLLMYHCRIHTNVSIYIVVLLWKCHKLSYATGTVMLLWKRLICHNIYIYTHTHIYIHIYTCTCTYIYIYIHGLAYPRSISSFTILIKLGKNKYRKASYFRLFTKYY